MQNKVSIILPTYGRPVYLSNAIKSVIDQTYSNWELIVVDDNDPMSSNREKTEKLMDTYANYHNIMYIKHDYNKNGSAARNTGIAYATGQYITFLDDDDEYYPERLQYCVDALNKSGDIYGGVYTGCKFYKNGKYYRTCRKANSGNYLVDTLATTFNSYSGSNLFFRSSVVKQLDGFDEAFRRHQDYEFLVRFFCHYNIKGIPKVLLIKHENGENLPNVEKLSKIKEQYLNKYSNIITSLTNDEANLIYYANYMGLACMALDTNNIELFQCYYQKSFYYARPLLRDTIKIIIKRIIRFIRKYV